MTERESEVHYRHGECVMQGHLVRPISATGRTVLIFPDGFGLGEPAKRRARMLAELGYIAFVADPYGDGRMAQDLAEGHARSGALLHDLGELRGRAVAAFDVLAGQAGVDVNTIAAIGYCFGGTCALELARNGANLAALVSFHGSLATTRPAAKAIRPKILICTGSADPLVPLEQIRPFSEEMDRAGCRWRLDLYGGVKHNFTNPDADAIGRPGVGYDESADTNSWRSMCDLFAGTIG